MARGLVIFGRRVRICVASKQRSSRGLAKKAPCLSFVRAFTYAYEQLACARMVFGRVEVCGRRVGRFWMRALAAHGIVKTVSCKTTGIGSAMRNASTRRGGRLDRDDCSW
jgi:hypothetical protein